MPDSQALTIIAIITAHPDKAALLRAEQEKLVADTLKEDGCLRYELHQSNDGGHTLIFVESWATEAHWQAHMNGEAIRKFRASGAREYIVSSTLHQLTHIAG